MSEIEYSFLHSERDIQHGDVVDINELLSAQTSIAMRRDHHDIVRTICGGQLLVARDGTRAASGRAPIVGMGTLFSLPALRVPHGHVEDIVVAPGYGRIVDTIVERLLAQAKNLGLRYVEIVSDQEWARRLHLEHRCVLQSSAVYHYRIAPSDAG